MLRRGLFLAATLLVAGTVRAEPLTTADGKEHTVTVVRVTGEGVVVKALDGEKTYRYEELDGTSAYRYMRRTVADGDAGGHLRLGKYCLKRKLTDEAKAELLLAKKLDPKLAGEVDRIWAETNAERPRRTLSAEQIESIAAEQRSRGEQVEKACGQAVTTLETDHFVIYTTFGRVEHKPLETLCERLYRGFDRIFEISRNNDAMWDGKCMMYLFRDRDGFVKFSREVHQYPGQAAGGYFRARGGQCEVVIPMLGGVDRFKETMVHEGAHAFLHFYRDPGHIPTWVQEGVAQYFEFTEFPDGSMRKAHLRRVVGAVKAGTVLPLKTLAESRRPAGGADVEAYAYCYAYVDYLIEKDPKCFAEFVRRMKAGLEAEEALKAAYGWDFEELQKRWVRAVARGS